MENYEIMPNDLSEPLKLNQEAVHSLQETRKWTTFFGILGIILIVIMLIISLIMALVLPFLNEPVNTPFPPALLSIVYLIIAGIYILPVIYLMRFGSFARKALSVSSDQMLGQAMKNLALHFRTVGIITIAMICLYILAIIFMVIFGMGMYAGNMIGA
jgi:hypothetical protein